MGMVINLVKISLIESRAIESDLQQSIEEEHGCFVMAGL
jgi:hypothetical protein